MPPGGIAPRDAVLTLLGDPGGNLARLEHAKRIGSNFTVSIARVTLDAQYAANTAR